MPNMSNISRKSRITDPFKAGNVLRTIEITKGFGDDVNL
jgi:hypothetical protein